MKHTHSFYFIIATLVLLFSFTISANEANTGTQTFALQIWAPDEIPPADAKHVEIGEGYYYRYTPESVVFTTNTNRKLNIEFASILNDRYAFRWVTATSPGDLTLEEKSDNLMRIAIDDGNDVADDMYLEVWVLDTQTGERFMCDPQVRNKG